MSTKAPVLPSKQCAELNKSVPGSKLWSSGGEGTPPYFPERTELTLFRGQQARMQPRHPFPWWPFPLLRSTVVPL